MALTSLLNPLTDVAKVDFAVQKIPCRYNNQNNTAWHTHSHTSWEESQALCQRLLLSLHNAHRCVKWYGCNTLPINLTIPRCFELKVPSWCIRINSRCATILRNQPGVQSNAHFHFSPTVSPYWIPNPLPHSIPLSTSLWLDLFCRSQSRWAPVCSIPGVRMGDHLIRYRKSKSLRNEMSGERPRQTKNGSWANARMSKKTERYLPKIGEEDLSDGTEGHRHILFGDVTIRGECSCAACTGLLGHKNPLLLYKG